MVDIVKEAALQIGSFIGLDLGQTNLLIVFLGLICMGISFHGKSDWSKWMAPIGWVCVGIYFYLGADYYFQIDDPVLIFMSLAALPVCVAYAAWEGLNAREGRVVESVEWLRGAVFWSAMPYLAIQHVPMLNAGVVWFTAWNTSLMLQWTGAGDIHLGQMMVDLGGGKEVSWSEWQGNRWLLTDTLGEGGFYVPMEQANGDSINIGFVLGCSALQSMIIFVGALVAVREAPWRRRMRALYIAIPVIHVLNVFRNAGIIWMHITYSNSWRLNGINIFDFGHAYAAKILSLGAMFIIAIVIFELLPKLHQHVLDVLSPVLRPLGLLPPKINA